MEEYQHVDIQIRELTNRKKEISEKISQDMQRDQVDKFEADFGKFFLKAVPTYEYSVNTQLMEKEIKEIKKQEIDTGRATLKSNKLSLSFRQAK